MTRARNDSTTGTGPVPLGAGSAWVAKALAERRADILGRWRDVTSQQTFHQGRDALGVDGHIPALFDALVLLLQQRTSPQATPSGALLEDPLVLEEVRSYARKRFQQGLSAAHVMTEFRLLREKIARALRDELAPDAPTHDLTGAELLVHDVLDGVVVLALTMHVGQMQEEFLATTLHDVRQPLTSLKIDLQGASRRLKGATPDLEAVARSFQRLEQQADRIMVLVSTLSEVSRLEDGRLEAHSEPGDMGTLVRHVLDRFGGDVLQRVDVTSPEGTDLRGHWDLSLIDRVVANLVSNALKYSPPETPVHLDLTSDPASVRLSVTDQGIGLAPDEIPRLFRRYGRAPGAVAAEVEGLGLGLFLSKGIVEQHGGRFWAESPGRGLGTTFLLVLPRTIAGHHVGMDAPAANTGGEAAPAASLPRGSAVPSMPGGHSGLLLRDIRQGSSMIRSREEPPLQCVCCGQSPGPNPLGPGEFVHGLGLCERCRSTAPASRGASRRKRAKTTALGARA